MNDETNYALQEPFDIDNGELDGIDAVNAFVMGCEWQMVSQQLDGTDAFSRPIHDANASRIKRMCVRRGRRFKVTDNGPEWKWLEVEAA